MIARPLLIAATLALGTAAFAGRASAQTYDYIGSPVTNMPGATCLPVTSNSDDGFTNSEVLRSISGGLHVNSTFTSGGGISFTCPLARRNSTDYGKYPVNQAANDRILMSSLRVRVKDGSSTDGMACVAYVVTATGGSYSSSWLYPCSTTGGCTTQPADSFTGTSELLWSNPFGTTPIVSTGAASVGYTCVVPKNSYVYWAEAAYSPNN